MDDTGTRGMYWAVEGSVAVDELGGLQHEADRVGAVEGSHGVSSGVCEGHRVRDFKDADEVVLFLKGSKTDQYNTGFMRNLYDFWNGMAIVTPADGQGVLWNKAG